MHMPNSIISRIISLCAGVARGRFVRPISPVGKRYRYKFDAHCSRLLLLAELCTTRVKKLE